MTEYRIASLKWDHNRPGGRVLFVRGHEWTWASWSAPTGCGPATASTRWTGLLPPELIGSHVGSARSHTTGRRHDLAFRATTSLFGHLGIEWDLVAADPGELAEVGVQAPPLHPEQALLVHQVRS